jgi:hypothetical protein
MIIFKSVNKKKFIQIYLFRKTTEQLFKRIKKDEYISPDEVKSSWKEIEKENTRYFVESKRRSGRLILQELVAASFLLIFSLSVKMLIAPVGGNPSLSTDLLNERTLTSSVKEISLISSGKCISLANNSNVYYSKTGLINVNKKQVYGFQQGLRDKQSLQLNHLLVPKGKRVHVTFSDGTKMSVNADSHVVFPSVFTHGRREIVMQGEVYLEVTHNPQAPFIVKSNEFSVRVLGTKFDVSAYKFDKTASVVLVKGCVEVETKRKEKVRLSPNHLMSITTNGTKIERVDVSQYICWKDNMMILNSDKAGIILKRLARYYGVNIRCAENVENIPISGKLDLRSNVDEVINILKSSAFLRYKKDSKGYYVYLNR